MSCCRSRVGSLRAGELCKEFASQSTTHGLRRISETRNHACRIAWAVIFLTALGGCTYHSSFLVRKYLSFGTVTTTQEIHAPELDFPALTVCNMNILKKSFLEDQLEKNKNSEEERKKGFCFASEDDFLNKSNTKDLGDIWENLAVSVDSLQKFGHQVYDLIVQCTYNARDCFNRSITKDLPLITENISISDYPSTRLGYCHTIMLNKSTLGRVRRTGQTLGLTLTLNIERDEYWNLLSPEYGVRLLIHPRQAYPTIDRGGIVLHPGMKTYVSIRIRQIQRMPYPYGDCTKTFEDSPLAELLKNQDDDFLRGHKYYTYEFCQTLCKQNRLLKECNCVEEQINSTHKFCNPCNQTQNRCREEFNDLFDADVNNTCTTLCKPACEDTRYDVTLSRSEWPNLEFQEFVLKRWPELRSDFTQGNASTDDNKVEINETYINKNFLRVHVFIQEMNYVSYKDIVAYALPELFADLGGCLGLYIGVSLISIIEVTELLFSILALFTTKLNGTLQGENKNSSSRSFRVHVSRGEGNGKLVPFKNRMGRTRNDGQPPMYWIGERNGQGRGAFARTEAENLTDDEMLSSKLCLRCLSHIQSLQNGQIFRRRRPNVILRSLPEISLPKSTHSHDFLRT